MWKKEGPSFLACMSQRLPSGGTQVLTSFGLGKDHPTRIGLQRAGDSDLQFLADSVSGALDHDHRSVIQIARRPARALRQL